jgi:hypothetical protein
MERIRPAHLERAERLGAQIIVSLAAQPGGLRNTYDYRILSREALQRAMEGTIIVSGRTPPRKRTSEPIPCPLRGCDLPTLATAMDHALDRFAAGEFDEQARA